MPQVPQAPQAPQAVDDSGAVEPFVLSNQGSAIDLMVEERSPIAPTADRAETFNVTAEQINQNLANPSEQQASPLNFLGETFSLPEGTVVRGVNRGGVAIGSELR